MNGDRFAPIVFLFSWVSISTPLTKKDSLSAQPNFLRFGLGQSAQSNFMVKLNTTMVDPSVTISSSFVITCINFHTTDKEIFSFDKERFTIYEGQISLDWHFNC